MGRNTVGREARKKGYHTAEAIQRGIEKHLSGLSIRKAAKDCNLPYPTLRRYVTKYRNNPSCRLEPHYDASKIFTDQQEDSIKEYLLDCANKFYGLTSKDCRRIAYQLAVINKIEMPPSWKVHEMAGRDWMRGFRARHPELTVKKPEPCSIARATAFNKINVQNFFDNLKEVLSRNPSFANGSRIYNLDETSTTTVQRPHKVLAAKGRNVCKVTSGERGILVTTCCIVNAIGQALPPAMVFPRKNFKAHMLYGAPPGTLGLAAPSGWMNTELFVEFTSASTDNPALLILDNHESHLSIEALDLAKASGVTVLTLHPHTTARLQPLDVGLNGPFKSFYNSAIDSWLLRNPGKNLSIYNVAECVGIAYMKAMTPTNITQAFKKCGIFPFDDQIFTDIDFLPSEITNRPPPNVIDVEKYPDDVGRCGSPSILTPAIYSDDDETDAEIENIMEELPYNKPLPSTSYHTPSTSEVHITPQAEVSAAITDDRESNYIFQSQVMSSPNIVTQEIASCSKETSQPTASTSRVQISSEIKTSSPKMSGGSNNFISPKIFRPPLKAGPRKTIKRKLGKSMIATDTPEKNALAEKKQNKEKKKKLAKVVKTKLFESIKREQSDTSDDEEFICSGSSSGGDFFIESDEEEIILNDNFSPLSRKPRPDDYVIVAFNIKKLNVFYVAQILEELEEEDGDYYVSFFKLKSKITQTFSLPLEPDTAAVNKTDIKYILPLPNINGTVRRQATYKFPIDMSLLNLRY
ncbi:uncharacterized protein LOC111363186 isoform X2 [Spodoptera litura]|uniref:Uncharacterized protein LOC111363186 isoform X2 n=1 Tax=Spodoptera litura TaxID=69820 RepID=A0A9J7EV58_SPOLT|nr:uncharacterized protein LOC111363186 isoform X2 [Spodoptera litura]